MARAGGGEDVSSDAPAGGPGRLPARTVVVIGASLGGIEALCKLAAGLPADFEASVAIVLHTHPSSPMQLAAIIGRHTPLSVSYAKSGDEIVAGCIYIAPPAHHLVMLPSGFFHLNTGPKERYCRPSANVLFRSAAEAYGPRVVGVVLTGGDGDGTEGLQAIHAAGGLCVVQTPAEATDPGMPSHAVRFDHPNYQVSLDDMPALLTKLVAGERPAGSTP